MVAQIGETSPRGPMSRCRESNPRQPKVWLAATALALLMLPVVSVWVWAMMRDKAS
uniref:Transmembrane protein n=1 Tax=Ralstonia solanacearum TaxID=305 RepID=A0A0S4U0B4_RALSL|nr:protein of unknown function [Ralstonia solanacearum]